MKIDCSLDRETIQYERFEISTWKDLSEKIVIEQIQIFQNEKISNKSNEIDRSSKLQVHVCKHI